MFSSHLSTCERSRRVAVMLLLDVLSGYVCAKVRAAGRNSRPPAQWPLAAGHRDGVR